ncbi:hypothetical protein Aduo_019317 [Ancylostoma duodenale]
METWIRVILIVPFVANAKATTADRRFADITDYSWNTADGNRQQLNPIRYICNPGQACVLLNPQRGHRTPRHLICAPFKQLTEEHR